MANDNPIREFRYEGKPIYELPSVSKIKDLEEQMEEIDKRLKALRAWYVNEKMILTDLHISNALGISRSTMNRWLRGLVRDENGKAVRVETTNTSPEDKRLIRERADLLCKWHEYCAQWCLDSVASDTVPSRSIYLSKAIFHNWDSPQEKKDNNLHVEVLIQKLKESKNNPS